MHGPDRSGCRNERKQRPRPQRDHSERRECRGGKEREVKAARRTVAHFHGQRAFAGCFIAGDIAQVVDDQQRGRQRADRERRQCGDDGQGSVLHVRRAERSDQSEEDEDEHFAETVVAVRLRSTGVEPRRGNRGKADGDQPRIDL